MSVRDLLRQEEQDAARAVRRRAAVAAATDLFARDGFHATSMADIAKTAGLSLKALYDSFPSKEALFEAVLADVGEKFSALLQTPETGADPMRWILGFVQRTVELLAANAPALRLYSRGADGIPKELRDRGVNPFAEGRHRVEEGLADAVRQVQRAGGARRIEAGALARGVLTLTIAEAQHRLDAGLPVSGAVSALGPIIESLLA